MVNFSSLSFSLCLHTWDDLQSMKHVLLAERVHDLPVGVAWRVDLGAKFRPCYANLA